ncbi:MAG: hypothetical protein GX798_02910 [Bacteroidales bacterium]|jgi:hypothetical protein|nr:hypothetical protein [Bacteroidales bacterium]
MKRIFLILSVALAAIMPLRAQYYFATQSGSQVTYSIYDSKGDLRGSYDETVKSINAESLDDISVVLEQVYFDKDGQHLLKDKSSNLSLYIKEGEVTAQLETIKKGLITQDLMVRGCVIYVPSDIKSGDKLPDRTLSIKIGKIGGTISLTERKVLGMESVTVPAGTFQAAKVQEKQKTRVAIVTEEVTIITWMVKDLGCVRQESYDSKGRLVQTIEMVKK